MLMITIILLGINTFVFLLGVPAAILIVLEVKPYIGQYFYGEEESVHKSLDWFNGAIQAVSLMIIAVCIRYIGEKGEMPVYLLGEALWYTWLFTKLFVGRALLLQVIRYTKERLDKIPSKTKWSLPKGKLY